MRTISGNSSLVGVLLVLFMLCTGGIGIMFWHAPIPADELTPAQTNLISIGDWMVKASVGAILGTIGGVRIATVANGGGAAQ